MGKKILATLIALILTLFLLPVRSVDAAETRSLTLVCSLDEQSIYDMTWDIYLVAEEIKSQPTPSGGLTLSEENTEEETYHSYELVGDFANYPVDMMDLNDSKMQDAADTLENYAILDGIEPLATMATDENGEWTIDGLEPGLYLLSGTDVVIGNTVYYPNAILFDLTDNSQTFDLMSYAKFLTSVLGAEERLYTVQKVWENDENYLEDRVEIRAGLYLDGVLYDTEVLNEDNNWTYSWYGMSNDDWRVKELDVPDNYTVVYRNDKKDYVIVNTHDEEEESTEELEKQPDSPSTDDETEETGIAGDEELIQTTTETTSPPVTDTSLPPEDTTIAVAGVVTSPGSSSSSTKTYTSSGSSSSTTYEKLPQTGLLWWPVPILLAFGVLSLCISFRLRRKNHS